MFRKHIEYTGISPELMSILDKVDGYNGMDRFARNLSDELLTDGKVFIGIDSPKDGEGKPYALIYKRNQIINWSRDDAGNYNMLVAHEFVQDNEDIFQTDYVEQFKVFLADGSIQVWRYNNDGMNYICKMKYLQSLIEFLLLLLNWIMYLRYMM